MSGSSGVAVPLLDDPEPIISPAASDGRKHALSSRNKRAVSVRVNSFCLPTQSKEGPFPNALRLQSFQRTVQVLQLDHSHYKTSLLSWIIGLLLVVAVPVLRLWFVRASPNDSKHQLVFQPFVVVVGIALSTVSFVFLTQAIRRHGIRGVLFLDAAEQEVMEVQKEYDAVIEQCRMLLAKLFIPSLLVFTAFKSWFHVTVSLDPLPLEPETTALSISIIIILTTVSWIFQTTTYLYSCILFSTVCSLQELKMQRFKGLLEHGLDPEFYFTKYGRINKGLRATSHRFRAFLGLIFAITIIGFLASMYQVVEAERAGIDLLMAGEIIILNWVSLSGVGLCLRSSSKLAHLHRRIVKVAAAVHARLTFETGDFANLTVPGGSDYECNINVPIERFLNYFQAQDACSQRAALVNYLSSTSVGISVYGFVLDRFFIHTSIGILLTTIWFILGRSLND